MDRDPQQGKISDYSPACIRDSTILLGLEKDPVFLFEVIIDALSKTEEKDAFLEKMLEILSDRVIVLLRSARKSELLPLDLQMARFIHSMASQHRDFCLKLGVLADMLSRAAVFKGPCAEQDWPSILRDFGPCATDTLRVIIERTDSSEAKCVTLPEIQAAIPELAEGPGLDMLTELEEVGIIEKDQVRGTWVVRVTDAARNVLHIVSRQTEVRGQLTHAVAVVLPETETCPQPKE